MIENRKQRYRKKDIVLSPTQIYFNRSNEDDLEAFEVLEEIKVTLGGIKQEKSKALKELLRLYGRQQKKEAL